MQVAHLKVALRAGAKGQGRNPYSDHQSSQRKFMYCTFDTCLSLMQKCDEQHTPFSWTGGVRTKPVGPERCTLHFCFAVDIIIKRAGSTPLSNGLGESGRNLLGRNAAGCTGYSNSQTLDINTVSKYNTDILTSSPFSNNTSCRRGHLECSFWRQYMPTGSSIP